MKTCFDLQIGDKITVPSKDGYSTTEATIIDVLMIYNEPHYFVGISWYMYSSATKEKNWATTALIRHSHIKPYAAPIERYNHDQK